MAEFNGFSEMECARLSAREIEYLFFFQAEDGIRDKLVTGVQTCALPIWQGFKLPLLIGGATTSRVHTAVKIAPHYTSGPVIYVSDASRSVSVCQSLVSDDAAAKFIADVKVEYERVRTQQIGRASCRERV